MLVIRPAAGSLSFIQDGVWSFSSSFEETLILWRYPSRHEHNIHFVGSGESDVVMLSPSRLPSLGEVDAIAIQHDRDNKSAALEAAQRTGELDIEMKNSEVEEVLVKTGNMGQVAERSDWQTLEHSRLDSQDRESGIVRECMTNNEKPAIDLRERETSPHLEQPDVRSPCPDQISPAETSSSTNTWDEKRASDTPATRDPEPEPMILRFKKGRWDSYVPVPEQKLRNNLSGAVGYLEFANALDFAANVWNTIPVPTFAAALMV